MANIMERITADNKTTYTARIRIKGYRQQKAIFSRITDARLWIQKTESLIREGKYFSQAEAKRHTFADMTERYIKTVLPGSQDCFDKPAGFIVNPGMRNFFNRSGEPFRIPLIYIT